MKLNSATQGAIAIQIFPAREGIGHMQILISFDSSGPTTNSAEAIPFSLPCLHRSHRHSPPASPAPTKKHYFIPAVPGKPSGMPARRASRQAEQSAQLPRS